MRGLVNCEERGIPPSGVIGAGSIESEVGGCGPTGTSGNCSGSWCQVTDLVSPVGKTGAKGNVTTN
jgi:hypothetical protein